MARSFDPPTASVVHSVCAPHAREGEESAAIRHRRYGGPQDFHLISELLTRHYQPGNRDGNWFQAEWEYAYTHPCFEESAIGEIGR